MRSRSRSERVKCSSSGPTETERNISTGVPEDDKRTGAHRVRMVVSVEKQQLSEIVVSNSGQRITGICFQITI